MMEMTASPSNHTLDEQYDHLARSFNIMSVVIYCLAFVLGVIGNGVVIWVTGFKMKKTVNTVWFLNLAVADLLFTAFLPLSATYTALKFHWPFGFFMCKVDSTVRYLNIFASVYILVVISVDRCVSVVWPIWALNHRSVRKASCVSLGVWVLALIFSLPQLIFRDTDEDETIICYCNFIFSHETQNMQQLVEFRFTTVVITTFLLGFVVPFTVIVSCYAVIVYRLRRNRTLARRSSRSIKMITAVITAFFLCWAPFHIMDLIEVAYVIDNDPVLLPVIKIGVPLATGLAYLNSCLNPLLYVFMGRPFKNNVRKSILRVFESAFQEEVSRSNSTKVSQHQRDTSVLNTEV